LLKAFVRLCVAESMSAMSIPLEMIACALAGSPHAKDGARSTRMELRNQLTHHNGQQLPRSIRPSSRVGRPPSLCSAGRATMSDPTWCALRLATSSWCSCCTYLGPDAGTAGQLAVRCLTRAQGQPNPLIYRRRNWQRGYILRTFPWLAVGVCLALLAEPVSRRRISRGRPTL
jgi:hypothetical protein